MEFNKELWNLGRQIEDKTLPVINSFFECNFERNENNIWDVLDFKDDDNRIIVEIKGRRIPHDRYEDTIITASKVTAGHQAIEVGYRVFFVFVFTDKTLYRELKEDSSFKVEFTGTNTIPHYLIPIKELVEIDVEGDKFIDEEEPIKEEEDKEPNL